MSFDDKLGLSVLGARAGFLRRRQAGLPQPPIFPPGAPAAPQATAPVPMRNPMMRFNSQISTAAKGLAKDWWARLRKTYSGE